MSNSLIDQPLSRTIGLEIELSEWGTLERWKDIPYKIVHDGSVSPSGKEMVLPPASGREFQENLYKIGSALINYRAKVNNTCGLHVHVDGKDMSWYEARLLILIWLGIEQELFERFVEKGRIDGRFCIPYLGGGEDDGDIHPNVFRSNTGALLLKALLNPTSPITEIKSFWIQAFYNGRFIPGPKGKPILQDHGGNYSACKQNKYFQCRYHALNFHSWLYRNTFEFRLKEGTVDGVEIRDWALMCGWIVELANRINFEQALSVYNGGMKALVNLTSPSRFALKDIPILPTPIQTYITERMK